MPGLVPGIHVFLSHHEKHVHGRDELGHDDLEILSLSRQLYFASWPPLNT